LKLAVSKRRNKEVAVSLKKSTVSVSETLSEMPEDDGQRPK